jgi:hypothetical protein
MARVIHDGNLRSAGSRSESLTAYGVAECYRKTNLGYTDLRGIKCERPANITPRMTATDRLDGNGNTPPGKRSHKRRKSLIWIADVAHIPERSNVRDGQNV